MVMPFRRKRVTQARPEAPTEVDCDRLWDAALRPALDELGYLPVRADVETGSVIVKDMLNRLRHSALVVADVSLPNGNVYYEVGIRHAACEDHCVLLAADWSKQLFDLDQFRTLRYPLPDGNVPDAQAEAIRALVVRSLPELRSGRSPFHELVDDRVEEAFADQAQALASFQADLARVRLLSDEGEKASAIAELVAAQTQAALSQPAIAIELIRLARDVLGWSVLLRLVESLPGEVRSSDVVQEQLLLAQSKLGDHASATAGLEALIGRLGPTPERCGLLGGRYKRLWREERDRRGAQGAAEPSVDERRYLTRAIEAYERGMTLDLNEYYCSSNLPGLLRARGRSGDSERATSIEALVVAACRRAEALSQGDEFLYDTLFGAAFRSGDLAQLRDLADRVEQGVPWRLGSTLEDARDWIDLAPAASRGELKEILDRLTRVFKGAPIR
jgi:hypothetical protein